MPDVIIQEQLLTDTIEYMEWSIKYLKWAHDETGIPGNYSPELQKAIDTLDLLKVEQAKL